MGQAPEEYEAWLKAQRKPISESQTQDAVAGEQIFVTGPCSMYHPVRGTIAGGRVAPNLTHIGSRQFILANLFPNNDAYFEAWITDARSLKPRTQMPDLTQFNGEQLPDLVAYLDQLK